MRESHRQPRIFAVGDIHGCHEKLKLLIGRLPLDPAKDFLIFLGDYINRGEESRQVIEFLLDLEQKVRNTVFLLGNHEHSVLVYADSGNPDDLRALRPLNVETTLASYGNSSMRDMRNLDFMPAAHKVFLRRLKRCHRLGKYLFIHAGIIPGEDLQACSLDRLLNVRDPFLSCPDPADEIVVFGHTPFTTPLVTCNKIGIDTGAVYGNLLTAVELPQLRFHHA